ncbi:hypothetical protein SeMB42_g02595 [Synchytrium endobioticum]|uniref:Uncharacterized protein n=1 Tax=Synchytrium endobioticum TaxID=286115 RepID=A0A507DDU4_9FUNG|nr:hypothetical protein SeMB42_g02595 [Synchytrium endobioticum]
METNHWGFAVNPVDLSAPEYEISEQVNLEFQDTDEADLEKWKEWSTADYNQWDTDLLTELVELAQYAFPAGNQESPAQRGVRRPSRRSVDSIVQQNARRDMPLPSRRSVDSMVQQDARRDMPLPGRRSVDSMVQQDARRDAPLSDRRRVDSMMQQDARRDVPLPGRRSLDSFLQLHENRDSPIIGSTVNDHMRQSTPVHQSNGSRRFGSSRRFMTSVLKCIGR